MFCSYSWWWLSYTIQPLAHAPENIIYTHYTINSGKKKETLLALKIIQAIACFKLGMTGLIYYTQAPQDKAQYTKLSGILGKLKLISEPHIEFALQILVAAIEPLLSLEQSGVRYYVHYELNLMCNANQDEDGRCSFHTLSSHNSDGADDYNAQVSAQCYIEYIAPNLA